LAGYYVRFWSRILPILTRQEDTRARILNAENAESTEVFQPAKNGAWCVNLQALGKTGKKKMVKDAQKLSKS